METATKVKSASKARKRKPRVSATKAPTQVTFEPDTVATILNAAMANRAIQAMVTERLRGMGVDMSNKQVLFGGSITMSVVDAPEDGSRE